MLAGVTLNVVLNDNLVGKAESATSSYKEKQAKERLEMSLLSYKLALLSKEPGATIDSFLPEGATASLEGNKYTITIDGYTFEVDKDSLEILGQEEGASGGNTQPSETYTVTVTAGTGIASVTGGATINAGQSVIITATP